MIFFVDLTYAPSMVASDSHSHESFTSNSSATMVHTYHSFYDRKGSMDERMSTEELSLYRHGR